MKNAFTANTKVLLLLLLTMTGVARAQTHEFAPIGAEWYYQRLYHEGWNLIGVTYDRFRSLRTVEINGWECKEIEMFQNLDCDGLVNPHTEYRYIYQEGDQVYEVENGQRYLMYDLSKGPGEYWVAEQYRDTVYVVSVDYLELNDGSYRRIWRTRPENQSYLYIHNIIEGIGMDRSVFPFYDLDGPPPCMHDEIRCYSEDGVPLIVSEEEECDYEILSIEEGSMENSFIIHPNPTSEMVHIEGVDVAEVQIFNMLGQKVKTVTDSNEIDMDGLVEGVYLLKVTDKAGAIHTGKVMKKSK